MSAGRDAGAGAPRPVGAIESLSGRYALFLFDQFGVLHDGTRAYPGMHATLRAIKAAGRAVGVVTNSGKRADYNRARLAAFGFDASLVDVVASSGEVAWRRLAGVDAGAGAAPAAGARVLVVGRGGDRGFLDALPVTETDDAGTCDLVLIAGCEPERFALEDYRARLAPAAARGVPALCTNPDRVMLLGDGATGFAAGVVADAYAALGGPVERIGKPWPAIYAHALAACGATPARTLCIGDSVEHDVGGARAAGCDALLVDTGIHAGLDAAGRAALFAAEGLVPDWLLVRGTVPGGDVSSA